MPNYRRALQPGGVYFFTVVTYGRRRILCDTAVRAALRGAVENVRENHPFLIDAWVLLPDHLHCIWTLPPDDADFSKRWALIKRHVTKTVHHAYHECDRMTATKRCRQESTIWQRRFWEHQIRDTEDFRRHLDYLHFNPVKHGYAAHAGAWPYSTFHRYVRNGIYPSDWAGDGVESSNDSFGPDSFGNGE